MRNNAIKAISAAAAICFAMTGCGGTSGNTGDSGSSWGGAFDSIGGTSGSTSASTSASASQSGGSAVTEERDFGDSGSVLSVIDGKLDIDRLSRAEEKPMGGDDWTILVYMCGTDLETDGANASADLYEAYEADRRDNVNFVFQTGGTYEWYYDDIDATKTQRFIMEEDDYRLVDEQPLTNMGDPDTLADFIKWGVKEFPANNIGLVFWNHGGGSISGVCFDERYDSDSLSLSEIDKALSDTFDCMTEKFEFIGFDACLMSTIETANILVPYANYMYASEETEPGYGWDYTAIIDYLNGNPKADGAQLGKALCDAYYEHCKLSWSEDTATFAITDLTKIDALIESFNKTAQQIYESEDFTKIVKSVQEVDNFGGNNRTEGYTNMVDLGGILEAVETYCPNARDTLAKLDDAVSYMKNGYQHSDATGLAVYYPLAVQGSTELSTLGKICPSSYYLAFADKVAYGTTGQDIFSYNNDNLVGDCLNIWDIDFDYGDYSTNTDEFVDIGATSTIPVEDIYFDDDGYYTVAISDFSNLSYAACSLFLEDTDGTSIYLGCDDEVYYDWDNGIITDNFDGTWVSLPDGQPLPIEIVDQTEDYSLYTCSILLNGEYTNLRIEYDWNASCWNILGAWDGIDADTGMAARDIVQIEDGDVIQPVYYYIDYYTSDYFAGDKYTVNGAIDLSYQMLPATDYTYSMTLYDIYGNWYFTPDVTFTVDEEGGLTFYPEELEDGYYDGGYDDGYYDDTYSDYEYVTCSECYGTGCDWCGYYGYLLSYPCEECWGSGCSECDWYGDFLAIACDYCHGAGCDYCYEYY